jgi:site-specific DNA-methyltransferase (adenine-specific)
MTWAPYYQDEWTTIYHGDCRDVMEEVDLEAAILLTDPPYGINAEQGQQQRAGRQDGNAMAPSSGYAIGGWDAEPVDMRTILQLKRLAPHAIIWGGNYYALPPTGAWLIWDKQTGSNGYADCEMAWTSLTQAARLYSHQWKGMLRASERQKRIHPTQKPVQLMSWCLGFVEAPGVVLDPFMGSGPVARAARDAGRKYIGIEISEQYCEWVVENRLSQQVMDFA